MRIQLANKTGKYKICQISLTEAKKMEQGNILIALIDDNYYFGTVYKRGLMTCLFIRDMTQNKDWDLYLDERYLSCRIKLFKFK